MDKWTIIRTILRIATSLNTALCVTTSAICDLKITYLTIGWAVLTILTDFIVAFFTTYYNNDYTEEGCEGTGLTRLKKRQKKGKAACIEEDKDDE